MPYKNEHTLLENTQRLKSSSHSRVGYFDALRVFATLSVVFLHFSVTNWYGSPITSFSWMVCAAYDSIVRWCVPCFIMMSGALFIKKEINIKRLYSKYILRIIVAFFFWSILYTFIPNGHIASANKLHSIFMGHYHMWFLFIIIGLYIISPVFSSMKGNPNLVRYVLLIMFVFSILIPSISAIMQIFNENLYSTFSGYIEKFNPFLNVRYAFYFVLGYYLDTVKLSKKNVRLIYFLGIIGFTLTILLTITYSIHIAERSDIFFDYLSINVVLESMAVFIFAKNNFDFIKSDGVINSVIRFISKYSFGIYLVHPLFLEQARHYLNIQAMLFNPLIAIPFFSLVFFALSVITSFLLNKLPIIGKIIT